MTCQRLTAVAVVTSLTVAATAHAAPDGFPDPSFGQGGLQTIAFDLGSSNGDIARGMAVLPDGHILLAGVVENDLGASGIGLAQLTADGQPNGTFGQPWHLPEGLSLVEVHDMVLRPDSRIIVAGTGTLDGEPSDRPLVCQFLADGTPDLGFAATEPNPLAGSGCRLMHVDSVGFWAVSLQPDGHIILAGTILENDQRRGAVVRLDAVGNNDSSFDGDGIHILLPQWPLETFLTDVTLTPDGDVVATGFEFMMGNGSTNWLVFRLRGEDGAMDQSFDDDGVKVIDLNPNGFENAVAVTVLPSGTIVIGGEASGDGGSCPAVARLQPDGQFDFSFDGDGLFVDWMSCLLNLGFIDMLVQSDGKVVLIGKVWIWPGDFFVTRILPQGGIDPAFGVAGVSELNFSAHYGVEQSNDTVFRIASHGGRIVLAGDANPGVPGGSDFAIARLDNDLIFTDDME